MRVVNFNVYMGYDRRGEDNTFRVGRLLKNLEADIAGLQVNFVVVVVVVEIGLIWLQRAFQ